MKKIGVTVFTTLWGRHIPVPNELLKKSHITKDGRVDMRYSRQNEPLIEWMREQNEKDVA